MNNITDHRTLIDALGGNVSVHEKTGFPVPRIGQWKINNRIPPEYWPDLIKAASAQGVSGITAEWLMKTTPARKAIEPSLQSAPT